MKKKAFEFKKEVKNAKIELKKEIVGERWVMETKIKERIYIPLPGKVMGYIEILNMNNFKDILKKINVTCYIGERTINEKKGTEINYWIVYEKGGEKKGEKILNLIKKEVEQ